MVNYSLHGLVIASDLELDAPLSVSAGSVDWTITTGSSRPVPVDIPPGELLAEMRFGGGVGYAFVETPKNHLFRFYGTCDFEIDMAARRAVAFIDPSSNPGIAALLASGTLISSLLTFHGESVLHASAVVRGNRALAFIGRSGTGKTTMATLCCRSGATLLTDDTLRVVWSDETPACFSGTHELRLRPAAASLASAHEFERDDVSTTIDKRTGLTMTLGPLKSSLAALVIPNPSRTHHSLELKQLPQAEALLNLHAFLRVSGWKNRKILEQQFSFLSRIASTLPVYRATVPWGPPFQETLGQEILDFCLP